MASPVLLPPGIDFNVNEDAAVIGVKVVEHVLAAANDAIAQRGIFTIAFSGGSLPQVMARLCESDSQQWDKWHVFLSDERCVPLDDDDSNFKAVRILFGTRPVHLYPARVELPPEAMAADYAQQIATVFGIPAAPPAAGSSGALPQPPVFDMILLGMGPDGHTASLFPGHALLDCADRWVAYIEDSPKPPPCRITLTLPVLNAARCAIFIAAGRSKAPALAKIYTQKKPQGPHPLPAARVVPRGGTVSWYIDMDAASELDGQNKIEVVSATVVEGVNVPPPLP